LALSTLSLFLLSLSLSLSRSHKLEADQVPASVRCIARCGAGTNNIPVAQMTAAGIPVFNTPGANANSVKELVLAGLFLASRDIIGGALLGRGGGGGASR